MPHSFRRGPTILSALLPALTVGALGALGLVWGGYAQYVLSVSLIAIMCATSLVILVGLARVITLASGAMMCLGSYAVALLMLHFQVPFLLGIALASIVGALGGFVLGVPATRFRGHHLAMITLVFQFVVIIVVRQLEITGGAQGLRVPAVQLFGRPLASDAQFLVFTTVMASLIVVVMTVLARGHYGKTLRAISSTEIGAEAFGVNITWFRILAFVISSAVIALAGAVGAPQVKILDPDAYGIIHSVHLLAYPIVGGMTSIWGGILGGGSMRYMPEMLRFFAEYRELVYVGLVLAIIVFFPGGMVAIVEGAGGLLTRKLAPHAAVRIAPRTTRDRPRTQSRMRSDVPALAVTGLSKSYGALVAVNNVDLTVAAGSIHGLIGPNGAGKTTLFNLVSGFLTPDLGTVHLFGAPMHAKPARARIRHGVTRTFQNVAIYATLSCVDNVILGLGENGVLRSLGRSFGDAIQGPAAYARCERAFDALAAVGLDHLAFEPAGSLSLGNQRRLEIARAIVSKPRLLMLDEPVAGLEGDEQRSVCRLLLDINERLGVTMLVVEHNIRFVAELSHVLSVMNSGSLIAEGSPADVLERPEVREVYFGLAIEPT
jgi:ABC-type branched-subunit amino acid transport system ATPase component/ABC-type branched-subunit amino acid transport system permease subunit